MGKITGLEIIEQPYSLDRGAHLFFFFERALRLPNTSALQSTAVLANALLYYILAKALPYGNIALHFGETRKPFRRFPP